MGEMVNALETAAPEIAGKITFEDKMLPFPEEMDDAPLIEAIGTLPYTPLEQGVSATIDTFRAAVAAGKLSAANLS